MQKVSKCLQNNLNCSFYSKFVHEANKTLVVLLLSIGQNVLPGNLTRQQKFLIKRNKFKIQLLSEKSNLLPSKINSFIK